MIPVLIISSESCCKVFSVKLINLLGHHGDGSTLWHHGDGLGWLAVVQLLWWHHHGALWLHHDLLLHGHLLLLDHHWALRLHRHLALHVHLLLLLIDHLLLLSQLALHCDYLRLVVVLHGLLSVSLLLVWVLAICKHQALNARCGSVLTVLEEHGRVVWSSRDHEVLVVLSGLSQVLLDGIFGDFFLCIDNFADVRAPNG